MELPEIRVYSADDSLAGSTHRPAAVTTDLSRPPRMSSTSCGSALSKRNARASSNCQSPQLADAVADDCVRREGKVINETLKDFCQLDHIVKSDFADVADIMKQTASLCARANTVIRKFSSASLNTELLLFKAYCTPIYGCHFLVLRVSVLLS